MMCLHCMNMEYTWIYTYQTWGQFHLVNSNSISNLSIPIPFFTDSFTYYFLSWVGTRSTYLEYLLQVVYVPSRKYFWIKKLDGKLICGLNFFVGNFNSNSKFINSNSIFFNNQFWNWPSILELNWPHVWYLHCVSAIFCMFQCVCVILIV